MTVISKAGQVNTGAAGWPDITSADPVVRRIQGKLHGWAVANGERRFDDLFNLVCDPAVLTVAWERVAGTA